MLGFAIGGLIGAGVLRSTPYCENCTVYMRSRKLGSVPASIPIRNIGKNKQQEQQRYEAEQAQAAEKARAVLAAMAESAQKGDDLQFRRLMEEGGVTNRKKVGNLPLTFRVKLVYCPDCAQGRLVAESLKQEKNQTAVTEIGKWDLDPDFVARLGQFQPRQSPRAVSGGLGQAERRQCCGMGSSDAWIPMNRSFRALRLYGNACRREDKGLSTAAGENPAYHPHRCGRTTARPAASKARRRGPLPPFADIMTASRSRS